MDTAKSDDFVNIAIRIRPLNLDDDSSRGCVCHLSSDPPVIQVADRSFSFDNIFTGESEQATIYNETVAPLVEHAIKGYSSTVFAYGQTGTGKTYTMGTDPERYGQHSGLITRTLVDIFNRNDENNMITVEISFYEIYNEKVYDLLGESNNILLIKGFNVRGLSTHKVQNVEEAGRLLYRGGKQRHTGETKQNSSSSRSHAIFSIHCSIKNCNGNVESKLNLVDLAGSESVKKTGNEGNQLFEGININKGLLSIGQVINALSRKQSHVPHRQSTITTILKDTLSKKNFVNFIACISQKYEDMHETLQTLDFAQRAKRLKNKPEINTPKVADSLPMKHNPTPRTAHTLPSRRRLPFKTPVRMASTGALPPLHSSVISDFDHGDGHSNINSLSTISEIPVSISPIIARCVERVGDTFLDKVEEMMKQSVLMTPIKPNTPNLNRQDLLNEVKKIVQQEIQLAQTFRGQRSDRSRNVDDNMDNQTIEKEIGTSHQFMDFSDTSPIETHKSKNSEQEDSPSLFKVPKFVAPRRRSRLKTSSPIESQGKPVLRRSTRLSLKPATTYTNRDRRTMAAFEENSSPVQNNNKGMRRSVRLSLKQQSPYFGKTRKSMGIQKTPIPKPRLKLLQKSPKKPPPVPTPRTKKLTGSKISNNNRNILEILNTGTLSELSKLNSVGLKTANMILHYREREGNFQKITDLQNMPWRGKGYQRFLRENFLEET